MKKILRQIRLFFLPAVCSCCQKYIKDRAILCLQCSVKIKPIVSKDISLTKKYTMTVYAAGLYQDPIKKLILAKKWKDSLAACELAYLIYDYSVIKNKSFDYIVPVPLHWKRYISRGYNQAEETAKVLSEKMGVAYSDLLQRKKETTPQASLKARDRLANVKDVFVCSIAKRSLFKDKKILLVDDVMTTGATLHAAAKALLVLRPKKISAVVAARGT